MVDNPDISESGIAENDIPVGMGLSPLWTILSILTGLVWFHFSAVHASKFDPGADGSGKNWIGVSRVELDNRIIKGSVDEVAATISRLQAEHRRVVLLLGASHLHTISRGNEKQRIAVFHANRHLTEMGVNNQVFVQLSYGNANLHELLCVLLKLDSSNALPDAVVLGFTYDDCREPGIRKSLRLVDDEGGPYLHDQSMATLAKILRQSRQVTESAPVERIGIEKSLQSWMEKLLTQRMESVWSAYASRGKLWGQIELAAKERAVALLVGKKRRASIRVADGDFKDNLESLKSICKFLANQKIDFYVYRAPLLKRPGYSYYVQEEYEAAWKSVVSICRNFNVRCEDFDQLLEPERFGLTNSGLPDYFHFDEKGHKVLGRRIAEWIALEK